MTITHHPSNATLAAFAMGTLDEARSVVVATHLSLCPACREGVRAFEHAGGTLLDDVEPAAMGAGSRAQALERLGAPAPDAARETRPRDDLPAPLTLYDVGDWRWIGRGVYWRPVAVAAEPGSRVFMLKAAPGTKLPDHRHSDIEWTCVLEGAFRHDFGRYGPGDFDEADETVEHRPSVEEGVACVCLVALRGHIEFQGWLGRLLQPFVRI